MHLILGDPAVRRIAPRIVDEAAELPEGTKIDGDVMRVVGAAGIEGLPVIRRADAAVDRLGRRGPGSILTVKIVNAQFTERDGLTVAIEDLQLPNRCIGSRSSESPEPDVTSHRRRSDVELRRNQPRDIGLKRGNALAVRHVLCQGRHGITIPDRVCADVDCRQRRVPGLDVAAVGSEFLVPLRDRVDQVLEVQRG